MCDVRSVALHRTKRASSHRGAPCVTQRRASGCAALVGPSGLVPVGNRTGELGPARWRLSGTKPRGPRSLVLRNYVDLFVPGEREPNLCRRDGHGPAPGMQPHALGEDVDGRQAHPVSSPNVVRRHEHIVILPGDAGGLKPPDLDFRARLQNGACCMGVGCTIASPPEQPFSPRLRCSTSTWLHRSTEDSAVSVRSGRWNACAPCTDSDAKASSITSSGQATPLVGDASQFG